LGYVLYRRLRELGIKAYVSAPECLEQGKRKHNKLDARKLASRLYSYVQGDREMMRVVRVPTPPEERLRGQSRQLAQLVAMRKRLAAQGRALVLAQGYGMMKGGLVAADRLPQMGATFAGVDPQPTGSLAKQFEVTGQPNCAAQKGFDSS
jgi:transposase